MGIGYRSFDLHILDVKWYESVREGQRPSIKEAQNGFVVVDARRLWTNHEDTFVFPEQCDQVFYYPMHGDGNWMYVIDVAPRAARVVEPTNNLEPMNEVDRILDAADEHSDEGGSAMGDDSNAKISMSSESSSSDLGFLESSDVGEADLYVLDDETSSQSTIGFTLEVVVDIEPQNVHIDIL